MRKIILTGAVLAMLTSAAPMVHAQIPSDVQQALDKKVDKDKYDAEIKDLKEKAGKVDSFDGKITNIQKGLDSYKDENKQKLDGKVDTDKFEEELDTQRKSILGDVDNKITQAKDELKADIEKKIETQKNRINPLKSIAESNQNLLIGADKKSGLKKDVEDNKKLLVGADGNGGLKNDVKENKEKIGKVETEQTQQKQKIDEVNRKVEAMTNGQNDVKKDIAELGGRINVTGAMSAALAGLKPLQYDPMAPTQVMGSVSTYEGQQAYALGLAHFTSEDLMVHGGVSFTNSHKYMANVGVTYKFGHSAEKSMIPMRYQAGPISSIYVIQKENEMMREKMAQQEERIAQLEEMIMNMKK